VTDTEMYRNGFSGMSDENATLGKKNLELEARNTELAKQIDDQKAAGRDVLTYTQRLDTEYKAQTIVYDAMVKQLNASSDATVERNTRAAERLAAAQEENVRVNRAMAIFSVTQSLKSPPLQMPPAPIMRPVPSYQPPPQVRLNCTSSRIPYTDTVTTSCN
jgi:hypothetical protein